MATQNNSCAHYTASRDLLLRIKKTFSRTMFANFVLMLLIAACAIPAIGFSARGFETPENVNEGAYTIGDIFLFRYTTTSLATAAVALIIIFSTIIGGALAVLSAGQMKLATIGLIVLHALTAVVLLWTFLPYKILFLALYLALLCINIRCLWRYRDLAHLRTLPGYPHFSERLTQSEQPREELDLSHLHDAAPMEEVAVNRDAAPEAVPPMPGMELYGAVHARVNLDKGNRVKLSKQALRPTQNNQFDKINRETLDAIVPPALAEMEPSPTPKPALHAERLPSLEEIRSRYGQDNATDTGEAH